MSLGMVMHLRGVCQPMTESRSLRLKFHASLTSFTIGLSLGPSFFPDNMCSTLMSLGTVMHLERCVGLIQKVGDNDRHFILH